MSHHLDRPVDSSYEVFQLRRRRAELQTPELHPRLRDLYRVQGSITRDRYLLKRDQAAPVWDADVTPLWHVHGKAR